MPYTAAQLTAYYTSLVGVGPTTSDAASISDAAARSQAGTLSDVNTLLTVFNASGVQATFEVAESAYQFFTGTGVSAAGLAYLEGNAGGGNPNGLNTAAYAGFNTENRYYNFALNLASTGAAGNAAFVGTYGAMTFAQTVATAYQAIVGSTNAAAIADITGRQAAFTAIAQQRAGSVDAGGAAGQNIALKAVVVGYILEEANKADVGTYAAALDQLEAAVAARGAGATIASPFGSNILTTFGTGGSGFNTGFAALGANTTTPAQTLTLTTGADTVQPTGNTQIVGVVNGNGSAATSSLSTLQAGDQIRATGANNSLNVTTIGTVAAPQGDRNSVDALGGASISGVQTVNVTVAADPLAPTIRPSAVLNESLLPGVTQVNSVLSSGTLSVTNGAASVALGIVGNGVQSGELLAAYTTGGVATVNLSGGTTANSSVTLGSAVGVSVPTVNVTSSGAANVLSSLALPIGSLGATTLNIAASSALTITGPAANPASGGVLGAITTLNVTGSAPVNLGPGDISGLTGNPGVTTINSTGLSAAGGLTAHVATPTTAVAYALGAGADNLTVDGNLAAGSAVNLGAGANTLTVNGGLLGNASIIGGSGADVVTVTGLLSSSSVINTSGGGDTINVSTAIGGANQILTTAGATINGGGGATLVTDQANLLNLDNFSAANRALITGFGTVAVDDALTSGTTYDVNALGAQNFTTVGVTTGVAGAANVNVNTGAVITFAGNLGGFGGGNLATNIGTLNVREASVSAGQTSGNMLTLGYVNQGGFVTSSIGAAGVQTLNVVGSESARGNFNSVGSNTAARTGSDVAMSVQDSSLTTVTFSGNDSFGFTAINTQSPVLKTIDGSKATGDLSIDVTVIPTLVGPTSTQAAPITVTTGSGNDVVTVSDFARVTTGGTTPTATGAAGFNTINVGFTTSAQTYSSVLDAKAGDHLIFINSAFVNTTKIALAATASFQDFLNVALTQATTGHVGVISAFDFGGNTYLVNDVGVGGAFTQNSDSVIQLVGVHTIGSAFNPGSDVPRMGVILGS